MPTDIYVPIVDVSEHQGTIDFRVMRDRGVVGVIIRVCHGLTVDKRFESNWNAAQDVFGVNVGVYPFVNPKRGSARDCAEFLVETVDRVNGSVDVPVMFDIESYKDESPDRGLIWPADRYRPWLREHIHIVGELAPESTRIGYTNASFFNGWVNDPELAALIEWIVPRYPVYSLAGYQTYPLPADPNGWPAWAFARAPHGPFPPHGVGWAGWQMSAGFNRQGAAYGCQSSDLDLNIVRLSAWERWIRIDQPESEQPPLPIVEEDMKAIIYTVTTTTVGGAWFYVSPEGTVRQIRNVPEKDDWVAAGAVERTAESVAEFVNEMLPTFRPLGALSVQGKNVLGPEASAVWAARAAPPLGGSAAVAGYTGTISLTPKP